MHRSAKKCTFLIKCLPNASASGGSPPSAEALRKKGASPEGTRQKDNKDVGFMIVLLYHASPQLSMVLYNFQLFVQRCNAFLCTSYKSLVFQFPQFPFFLAHSILAFTQDLHLTAVYIVRYIIFLFRLDAELSGDEIRILHLAPAVGGFDK